VTELTHVDISDDLWDRWITRAKWFTFVQDNPMPFVMEAGQRDPTGQNITRLIGIIRQFADQHHSAVAKGIADELEQALNDSRLQTG
jgi:hypothetical protein